MYLLTKLNLMLMDCQPVFYRVAVLLLVHVVRLVIWISAHTWILTRATLESEISILIETRYTNEHTIIKELIENIM